MSIVNYNNVSLKTWLIEKVTESCSFLMWYDGLPLKLRYQGLLLQLLKGEVLPNCSVLVTSRPSATSDLLQACSPQIQKHREILGFTQEYVKDYASSVFSSQPEMLDDFLIYISASENPAINSLKYIPLNAAIIVHTYKNYWVWRRYEGGGGLEPPPPPPYFWPANFFTNRFRVCFMLEIEFCVLKTLEPPIEKHLPTPL